MQSMTSSTPSCVLFSGGLDSAVLLALELQSHRPVHPVHVRSGFAWEDAERRAIDRLLETPVYAGAAPLSTLNFDMRDVYPATHWAVVGQPPEYDTPDEDVYLEGRNIVLLSKTAILCARLGVNRIALGPLSNNPFPDASPEFFATMARALSLGLARDITVDTPLTSRHKEDVIKLGVELGVPFELSLSCMNPVSDEAAPPVHCGACSKCRERRDAFAEAGVPDPTVYKIEWKRRQA
jgi:7-cyano-7-deazaguanine synthase